MKISERVKAIVPSPTLLMDSTAKRMILEGNDVINLSVGEPDIPTPRLACDMAIEAIDHGFTKYTEVAGISDLRTALVMKVRHRLNLHYDPDQVVISNGGKHALFNVFSCLLDPGDEVIIPAPYWVSYPEQVKLCGAVPIVCKADESTGFKVTVPMLSRCLSSKTRILLLNSPSNPTGAVYSLSELEAIGQFVLEHNLLVVSDEIYDRLVFSSGPYWSIAQLGEKLLDRTIIVNGWSKTFGMTGWRLGYTLSNRIFAKAFRDFQGHVTSNVCSIAQKAALGALQSIDLDLPERYRARRDFLVESLRDIRGVVLPTPEGAFYVFPNLQSFVGGVYKARTIDSVDDFCMTFLADFNVSIVPGSGFGSPSNARLSYAIGMDRLAEAARRLREFTDQILPGKAPVPLSKPLSV